MACYQSLLTDPDVYDSFLMIVGKLRRFAKPEVKVNRVWDQICSTDIIVIF